MRKSKILKSKSKNGNLDIFCLWIKNEGKGKGYANGFVAIHKRHKIEEALKTEIDFGLSQNVDYKFYLKNNEEYNNYFVPFLRVQKCNPEDFFIVGFDTSKNNLTKYSQHNVETALLRFTKDIESIEITDEMINETSLNVLQVEFQEKLLSIQKQLFKLDDRNEEDLYKLNDLFYKYGRQQFNEGVETYNRLAKKLIFN